MIKKKKKICNSQKIKDFQNKIITYSQFINIPQLNNDDIDYTILNNSLGFDIIKSTNCNIIDNEFKLSNDNLIGNNKLEDVLVKTKKIVLIPTSKQKEILLKWMDSYIDMTNKVLEKIKKTRIEQNKKFKKVLKYNEINIDLNINKLKKEFNDYKNALSIKSGINKHILDYAINDAIIMFKSVVSNLDNGHIKKSRLRYIKKTRINKILKIEKHICSNNSFCSSKLGKIVKSVPQINYKNDIEKVSIIKYDIKKDIFYMYIRKKVEIKSNNIKEQKIISLDPGLRTFMSGISNDHTIEFASNLKHKFIKYFNKIDGIKKNNNIHNKKKHLTKYDNYLSDYIKDVHWQIVNILTTKYTHIFLGNFSTKNMVEDNKSSKLNKRIANALKLYQFRERLKYKCIIRDCKLKIIDEYNTSKCCSNCGNIKQDLKANKIYECIKCNCIYDRDLNASKNILIKGLNINEINI
jgi:hypothetical protein